MLYFDENFIVGSGYSKKCKAIFGEEDITNKRIDHLLFNLQEKRNQFCDATSLFFSKKADMDLVNRLLDDHLIINGFHLLVNYKAIDEFQILCIMTDISEKKQLENQLESNKEIQDFIFKIIKEKTI